MVPQPMRKPTTRAALWIALAVLQIGLRCGAVTAQAAITPEMAKRLFDQIAPLREADGCALAGFQTNRVDIVVELRAADGTTRALTIGSGTLEGDSPVAAGDWQLAVPDPTERDCGRTVDAIERILGTPASPRQEPWKAGRWTSVRENYTLLALQIAILVVASAILLARRLRGAPAAVTSALCAITGIGLLLRLLLSPRTFLHEYYHVGETLWSHLRGVAGPIYGDTGPAVYQLVAAASGSRGDAGAIFASNLVIASLAIPAIAFASYAVVRRWSHALLAAALLCMFPQHIRFSASEVLFVPAITFGFWAIALAMLYVDSRKLAHASCAALAFSIAIQTRPEMTFLPLAALALIALTRPRSLPVLWSRNSLLAGCLLGLLLVPRFVELWQVLHSQQIPQHVPPTLHRLQHSAVFLDAAITPPVYWLMTAVGAGWTLLRYPGLVVWAAAVATASIAFSLASGDNLPYNTRSQLLPNTLAILVAGGCGPLWLALFRERFGLAVKTGAALLSALAAVVVWRAVPFVTSVGDQQLEWSFLERSVAELPESGTLLTNVAVGRNLDAFPDFLLRREGKSYQLVDLAAAARGDVAWPRPGPDVLFYQGMFCHADFHDAAPPDPMTEPCNEVRRRYRTRPLIETKLDAYGFSALRYAEPPFDIGFFVLEDHADQLERLDAGAEVVPMGIR